MSCCCEECLASGSSHSREKCFTKGGNIRYTMLDTLSKGRHCRMRDSPDCIVSYSVSKVSGSNGYEAQIKAWQECGTRP